MADDKKQQDDRMLEMAGKMAEKIVEGLIPQLVATANILQKNTGAQGGTAGSTQKRHEYCGVCNQVLSACKGEHVSMVVYPTRREEFGPWFPGYKLNGIRYLSDRQGHQVLVPKCCAGEISNAIRLWEDTEANVRQGKTADHHSGSIDRPNRVENDGTRFR